MASGVGDSKIVKKLLFVVNVDWFFLSHRLPIALAAQKLGYEVHVATGITDRIEVLRSYGFIVHPLSIERSSLGVVGELRTFLEIYQLFKRMRPHLVHLVTIKPVLFGGIAARLAGIPGVVVAISGLGFVFLAQGTKAKVIRFFVSALYRLALGKKNLRVICQNTNDRDTLRNMAKIPLDKVVMIPGSGVDLSNYPVEDLPQGSPVVIMAARLLRDKGVREFVVAAEILKKRGENIRFWLVGDPDPGNPATITPHELSMWHAEGNVELLGYRNDIASLFSQASIVVLPSYYGEGLPKVLVEAAACGRAVITTDHPGCRDAIVPDESGILIPVKDSVALADAIQNLLGTPELCHSMGQAGRTLAERKFAIEKIVDSHLKIYTELEEAEC